MIRAFVLVGLGGLFSGLIFSQGTTNSPTFEVSSVKKNTSGERASADTKGDRLTMYNMPMRAILSMAYQVPNDGVVGPDWLDTDGFDIIAKLGPGTTSDNLWLMLQNLLAERFKLAVHHEQKTMQVYALVVAKGGPKLTEAAKDSHVKPTFSRQGIQATCHQQMTMVDLAKSLPHWVSMNYFGLPIIDQTGLTGVYDFSVTWTLTDKQDQAIDPPGVSLFDALQDQLGLKLEQRKAPMDRIVIDHIERVPLAN